MEMPVQYTPEMKEDIISGRKKLVTFVLDKEHYEGLGYEKIMDVEILKWDLKDVNPIVGVVKLKNGMESLKTWDHWGRRNTYIDKDGKLKTKFRWMDLWVMDPKESGVVEQQ